METTRGASCPRHKLKISSWNMGCAALKLSNEVEAGADRQRGFVELSLERLPETICADSAGEESCWALIGTLQRVARS